MHWFCRHCTSTQITWQQTWYFSLFLRAMDNISFLLFQRSTFSFRKSKSICLGKFLVHPMQVTRSTYSGIVFQTMHVSKISQT